MVQIVLSGLAIGSIYALIAQGFYITWITTKKFNFGQGDFMMAGAVVGLYASDSLHLPYYLSMIVVLASGIVLGLILERFTIRPLNKFPNSSSWVVSTLAMGMVLQNLAMLWVGRDQRPFPSPFGQEPVRIFSAGIMPHEIFTIIVSIGLMILLLVFLKKSVLGKALSAVAFNSDVSGLAGINVKRMVILTFCLSSALAGLAGILVGPIIFVNPYMGGIPGIKAFAVAIVGGLENPVGILIAGLGLGVLESTINFYSSQFTEVLVFLIIILVLTFRPAGLFVKVVGEKL